MKKFAVWVFSIVWGSAVAYGQAVPTLSFYAPEYPPLVVQDPSASNAKGLSIAIVREVLRRSDLKASVHVVPWARALEVAKSTPNAFVFPIIRTKERADSYLWIGPVAHFEYYVFALRDGNHRALGRIEDLAVHGVGILNRDVLEAYFESRGVKTSTKAPQLETLVRLFLNKRVRYIATTKVSLTYELNKLNRTLADVEAVLHLEDLSLEPYSYLAASLDTDQSVVRKLRSAFEAMKKDASLEKLLHATSEN